jgi:hypothetical protein
MEGFGEIQMHFVNSLFQGDGITEVPFPTGLIKELIKCPENWAVRPVKYDPAAEIAITEPRVPLGS